MYLNLLKTFFCISVVNSSSLLFSFLDFSFLDFFIVLLSSFFKSRRIFLVNFNFSFSSIWEGFYFFGWRFFLNKTDFFSISISYDNLKYHKLRLARILSLNYLFSFFYLLKLLNKEILIWTSNFCFSDSFYTFSFKLDFYVYQNVWKYVKKLHPRRPNTWIYNKYWKLYNSNSKFLLYDCFTGQLLFLSTHAFFPFSVSNIYFSNFFNTFNFLNVKRVNLLNYCSFSSYLYNVYYYLWKRQFGLCVVCSRVFDISKELNFKISVLYKNMSNVYFTRSYLVLIHKYC